MWHVAYLVIRAAGWRVVPIEWKVVRQGVYSGVGETHAESPAHCAYHPDLAQILCEWETLPRLHQSRVTELA
jgi:hypothetical protein